MTALDDFVATERAKVKNGYNIRRVTWQGRDGWLKFAIQQPQRRAQRGLQRMGAFFLDLPALRPAPLSDAADAIRREAAVMKKWKTLGLPAPALIAEGEDWFISEDAGAPLLTHLTALDEPARAALLHRVLDEILRVHAIGRYHGRPMLKDMSIAPDGRITLYDLEENPGDSMPRAAREARDLLVFLAAAARVADATTLDSLAAAATAQARPETQDEMRLIARRLAPFAALARLLPPAWLGREVESALVILSRLDRGGSEGV